MFAHMDVHVCAFGYLDCATHALVRCCFFVCALQVLDIDPLCAAAWQKKGDCLARLGADGTREAVDSDSDESRLQGVAAPFPILAES